MKRFPYHHPKHTQKHIINKPSPSSNIRLITLAKTVQHINRTVKEISLRQKSYILLVVLGVGYQPLTFPNSCDAQGHDPIGPVEYQVECPVDEIGSMPSKDVSHKGLECRLDIVKVVVDEEIDDDYNNHADIAKDVVFSSLRKWYVDVFPEDIGRIRGIENG